MENKISIACKLSHMTIYADKLVILSGIALYYYILHFPHVSMVTGSKSFSYTHRKL